jgi:hypothetical protein
VRRAAKRKTLYVIKNKGEVTPTVVGRLSDVEQTYGVGSIRYCFAPIAVIGPTHERPVANPHGGYVAVIA